MTKFKGIGGFHLHFDAFGSKRHVNLFDENNQLIAIHSLLTPTQVISKLWGREDACPFPLTARVRWRDESLGFTAENRAKLNDFESQNKYAYFGGNILGDYTIQVAERIPEDFLDEYRKHNEKEVWIYVKFRVHDDGLLLGWHLGNKKQRFMVGGDFEEAHYRYYIDDNGKSYRQKMHGWYIHPITKEKILTDF